MTYNVKSFRFGRGRVASIVAEAAPDVVLMQEAGRRGSLRRFAASLGMDAAWDPRLLKRIPHAVVFTRRFRLAEADVHTFTKWRGSPRRGVVSARLRSTEGSFVAVAAHLGLRPRERDHHARELTDLLGGYDGGVVVGIDLNEAPDAPASRWIADRFFDAFAHRGSGRAETFPAKAPTARIDYIFARDARAIADARVLDGGAARVASDHLPVVADLELGEP